MKKYPAKRFLNFIFLTRRRHYGNSFVVSLNGIILEGAETFFETEMNLNNTECRIYLRNVFYSAQLPLDLLSCPHIVWNQYNNYLGHMTFRRYASAFFLVKGI